MTAGFFVSSLRAKRSNPASFAAKGKLDCFVAPLLAMTAEATAAASQKTLRIDVDLELEIAFCLRPRRQPFAQVLREIDVAQRFHQQAESIAALDDRERRLRGAQHLHAVIDRGHGGKFSRKAFRPRTVARG